MRLRFVALVIAGAAALAVPASAHHSHNNYATSDFTFIEGTVKEIHFLNPHSWVYLEVKNDKGEPELWALEATGPRGLENNGITKDTLKVGERAKVRCHRLRDNTNGCLLGFLTPLHGDVSRGHGVEKEWD
jgi:Family of unknown function (DUF6152)